MSDDRDHLKACRVCGTPTEGWALEASPGARYQLVAVQSWCEKHCLAEFEEHDWFLESTDMLRYCARCGTEESPEATAQYLSDLQQDYGDD